MVVMRGQNLPDLDGFGAAAGETDMFVRVTIGNTVRSSSVVRNTLNPTWGGFFRDHNGNLEPRGEDMVFGVHRSGTIVKVEVFDADSGFEGADDHIATVIANVPACSFFLRDVCAESVYLPLSSRSCYLGNPEDPLYDPNNMQVDPTAPCVQIGFRITSFKVCCVCVRVSVRIYAPLVSVCHFFFTCVCQVKFESRAEFAASDPITLGMGNDPGAVTATQNAAYRVWANRPTTMYMTTMEYKEDLGAWDGGLYGPAFQANTIAIREADSDEVSSSYVQFTCNMACNIFVFRDQLDVDTWSIGWLDDLGFKGSHQGDPLFVGTSALTALQFVGYIRENWPANAAFTLPTQAYNRVGTAPINTQMIVMVGMVTDPTPPGDNGAKKFDRGKFMELAWQFVFPFAVILYPVLALLIKLRWRCVCVLCVCVLCVCVVCVCVCVVCVCCCPLVFRQLTPLQV